MERLKALVKYNCPNCFKGKIYKKRTLFGFGKIAENCSKCEHRFDKEPGFFFGAMYVSYALSIAEAVGAFIICQFLFTATFDPFMVPILLGTIVLLSGFNYTLSRVVWIYLFTGKNTSKTALKESV